MSGHGGSRKNSGRKRIAPSSSELREKHKEALAIVAKEEAMKNGYNSLLKQLATPSAPANKTTSLLSNDELEELFEEASNPAYVPATTRSIAPWKNQGSDDAIIGHTVKKQLLSVVEGPGTHAGKSTVGGLLGQTRILLQQQSARRAMKKRKKRKGMTRQLVGPCRPSKCDIL